MTHWFNFLFVAMLVRSGLEILSAHPKLYWNNDSMPGSEWLRFTRKTMPKDKLWTSVDEEAEFPSWVAMPGRRHNLGLGRYWHFTAIFGWTLAGVVYLVLLFATDQWRRLVPTSWTIVPDAWHDFVTYLSAPPWPLPGSEDGAAARPSPLTGDTHRLGPPRFEVRSPRHNLFPSPAPTTLIPRHFGLLNESRMSLIVDKSLAWPQWGSGPGGTSASGSGSRSRTAARRRG